MAEHHDVTPPKIASGIMLMCASPERRSEMIGDLTEEWQTRNATSPYGAKYWYWDQVIRSIPGIVFYRVRQTAPIRIGILALAYSVGLLAITYWDSAVSQQIVKGLLSQPDSLAPFYAHGIYFVLFTVGAAIAAVSTALLVFKRDQPFLDNMLIGYGPLFLIVSLHTFVNVSGTSTLGLALYFLFRSLILAATFVAGACAVRRWQNYYLS